MPCMVAQCCIYTLTICIHDALSPPKHPNPQQNRQRKHSLSTATPQTSQHTIRISRSTIFPCTLERQEQRTSHLPHPLVRQPLRVFRHNINSWDNLMPAQGTATRPSLHQSRTHHWPDERARATWDGETSAPYAASRENLNIRYRPTGIWKITTTLSPANMALPWSYRLNQKHSRYDTSQPEASGPALLVGPRLGPAASVSKDVVLAQSPVRCLKESTRVCDSTTQGHSSFEPAKDLQQKPGL